MQNSHCNKEPIGAMQQGTIQNLNYLKSWEIDISRPIHCSDLIQLLASFVLIYDSLFPNLLEG